jgi:hypothetical protein
MSSGVNTSFNISITGARRMDFKKTLRILQERPLLILSIVFLLGVLVTYAYIVSRTKFACATTTIDNSQSCHKYRVSPLPLKYIGKVSDSACPNKPPSNCP